MDYFDRIVYFPHVGRELDNSCCRGSSIGVADFAVWIADRFAKYAIDKTRKGQHVVGNSRLRFVFDF